jgi:hypothetical protein
VSVFGIGVILGVRVGKGVEVGVDVLVTVTVREGVGVGSILAGKQALRKRMIMKASER